jgi:hypothetical protein
LERRPVLDVRKLNQIHKSNILRALCDDIFVESHIYENLRRSERVACRQNDFEWKLIVHSSVLNFRKPFQNYEVSSNAVRQSKVFYYRLKSPVTL